MRALERIEPVVEEKLAAMGYELYDVKYIQSGSRSVLRIFVDNEQGITVKDCERISHEISVLLDVENFSHTPYTLEVSSPGIDRPLVTEKDFKRVIGKSVRFRIQHSDGKIKTLTGKLIACDNAICTVESGTETTEIPLKTVLSGKIEITFK